MPWTGSVQWDPPLMMFSSPQHPWGVLDGEQDNGILLIMLSSHHAGCPAWLAGQRGHTSSDAFQCPSTSFALFPPSWSSWEEHLRELAQPQVHLRSESHQYLGGVWVIWVVQVLPCPGTLPHH